MEVIQAIALLCQVHSNAPIDDIENAQLRCQKYYMACIEKAPMATLFIVKECIKGRQPASK